MYPPAQFYTNHVKWILTGKGEFLFEFIKEARDIINSSERHYNKAIKIEVFETLLSVVKSVDLINDKTKLLDFLDKHIKDYQDNVEISTKMADLYNFLSYELYNINQIKALNCINLAKHFYDLAVSKGQRRDLEVEKGIISLKAKLTTPPTFWLEKWQAHFRLLDTLLEILGQGDFGTAEKLLESLRSEDKEVFTNIVNNAKLVYEAEKIKQTSKEPEPKEASGLEPRSKQASEITPEPKQVSIKLEQPVTMEEISLKIKSPNWFNPRVTWKHIQKYFQLEKAKLSEKLLHEQDQEKEIPTWKVGDNIIQASSAGEVIEIGPNLYGMISSNLNIIRKDLESFKSAMIKGMISTESEGSGVKLIKNGKGQLYEVAIKKS